MSFAENLKFIRKERGITQEQLAEMLSVSRQAVSKWEIGAGFPETEKLLIISKELNVSLDYLLLDENVVEKKNEAEPRPVVYAPCGKIAIPSYDGNQVVVCSAVKSSQILFPGKNEPRFVLNGVDRVTFWGEHATMLGWYVSEEDIAREIEEITEAIHSGAASYKLKYAADVEYKGLFGQPRLKNRT